MVCDIVLPRQSVVLGATPKPVNASAAAVKVDRIATPKQHRILLVEDSYLVVIGLERMCENQGWEIVGPATRLGPAMLLAQNEVFEAALLDVNLDGEMSWEVAAILRDRGIPFAFTTGYDGASVLPKHLAGTPVISKPYAEIDVENVIRRLIAGSASKST